jgi:hypothetical protein
MFEVQTSHPLMPEIGFQGNLVGFGNSCVGRRVREAAAEYGLAAVEADTNGSEARLPVVNLVNLSVQASLITTNNVAGVLSVALPDVNGQPLAGIATFNQVNQTFTTSDHNFNMLVLKNTFNSFSGVAAVTTTANNLRLTASNSATHLTEATLFQINSAGSMTFDSDSSDRYLGQFAPGTKEADKDNITRYETGDYANILVDGRQHVTAAGSDVVTSDTPYIVLVDVDSTYKRGAIANAAGTPMTAKQMSTHLKFRQSALEGQLAQLSVDEGK